MRFDDTIVALSSGRLPAGVAVIRISGPQARFVVETICGELPFERRAELKTLRDPNGSVLDQGLVLFFGAPRSFTGEDSAEFHVHGGKAVVAKVLESLLTLPGTRQAEAGEFTRRAVLNGKLDLAQAEGLADLISAETEAQRMVALSNSGGAQTDLYGQWRGRLIRARALLEAELDFADEADIPGSVSDAAWDDVRDLRLALEMQIDAFARGEMVRDGFKVAIVGAPNAGKSSLLNALVRREAAIVSDEPGTTRDVIEVVLDLKGIKVRVFDTAGLRDDPGRIEQMGIERALDAARNADLTMQVTEVGAQAIIIRDFAGDVLHIRSKADLADAAALVEELRISTVTGEGLDVLLDEIGQRAEAAIGNLGDVLPSRIRHVELLNKAAQHLRLALGDGSVALELRAEELRLAAESLGRIVGRVDVEDLLDAIFSQFCIGK